MKQLKKSRSKKIYQGTQAVRRAISILKTFTDERPSWALTDLSKQLGLNKTTVFRLLAALENERLVVHDPEKETYTLGSEMIVLGGRALRSSSLRQVSREELKTLADTSGETASLEVLSGKEVIILDEVVGDHLMGGVPSIGTRWPAFATSTGKAILAFSPDDEVDAVLKGPLPKITPKTVTSAEILRKQLAEIRERGYSVADEALELGYVAIGAPVHDHDGEVIAAISIGGPTLRLGGRSDEIGVLVRRAAERISIRLGYRS